MRVNYRLIFFSFARVVNSYSFPTIEPDFLKFIFSFFGCDIFFFFFSNNYYYYDYYYYYRSPLLLCTTQLSKIALLKCYDNAAAGRQASPSPFLFKKKKQQNKIKENNQHATIRSTPVALFFLLSVRFLSFFLSVFSWGIYTHTNRHKHSWKSE